MQITFSPVPANTMFVLYLMTISGKTFSESRLRL